jgi:amino acid adenylation domain-containing protein
MSYIYKTGDLARWLPDGNIDFLGRIDYQVKIRGYRIEPGEIESHLTKLEDINEAVAAVRKNGPEKYLCAYIVLKGSKVLDVVELKNKLSENLPDYMIPSYFVQIEKIPLTANGKVDRKALPEPDVKAGENYVPPRDKTEKELVEIWARVLGAEKDIIGIDSNFFDLGGHSLKATLLTARVHKEMNVKIPLAELFRTPTIREIAGYIKGLAEEKFLSIEAAEKKEYYKLSSAQKRMYVLQQMELKAINYNIPQVAVLKGDLSREKFEETFRKLIKRYESLRTSFHMIADQSFQRVHDQVEFKIENDEPGKEGTRGLAPLPIPVTGKSQPAANLIKNFVRPFDLAQAPLMRVGLVKEQDNTHILMIDIHHIITDGTSMGILIKEFMKLYAGEELPGTRIQYKDFSEWENKRYKSKEKNKQEEYWKKQFAGDIPVMDLPTDYPRPGIKTFAGSSLSFEINTEETRAVKSLVSEQGITLFIALAALFDIFLSKISSQEEIIIGIPTAGRRHADLAQIIGMFVNTLVLRNHPAGHKTIKEFLNEVKENALAAFENQEYQFEELVEKLALNRDISRNPLFEVMFSLHNQTDPEQIREIKVPDLKLKPYEYEERTAKFDLELIVVESNKRLSLTFIYGSKLFKKETVERFVNYFKRIVNFVVENSKTKIYEIDLLPGEEKKKILYHLNETTAPYPENKTIHELFAQQVEQTPDHIALVGKDEGWKGIRVEGEKEAGLRAESQELRAVTYKELNNNSNQLSHLLREKGIQTDTMAGIMVERSPDMIIGILGILKAGGAYLPIEPDYPEERINYMLADSGAKVLVTTSTLAKEGEKLRSLEVKKNFEVIFIDSVEFSRFSSSHLLNFSTSHSLNLAYIIYTSGSTGKPKGVMINHQNVVPLVKNPNFIDFTPGDRLLLTGNFVFDITTFETWWPLLNGLTLFPADQQVILDPEKLENFINKHKISILHLIPQLFNQLAGQRLEIFERLKYFLVGGDLVRPQYVNLLRNTYKDIKILHMYGPTENTTFSTFHPVNQYYDTTIPIGKPISNSSVYIVDKYDKPVPIGIPGELLVGGDGVARGYLNNPQLTAQKFDHDLWDYQDYQDEVQKVPGKRIPGGGYHRSYMSHMS